VSQLRKRREPLAGGSTSRDTEKQASGKHTLSAARGASVVIRKPSSGVEIVFSTYRTRAEADRVCERLRSVGCVADVDVQRATDVAGLERRTR
jgi:hypothetical protein